MALGAVNEANGRPDAAVPSPQAQRYRRHLEATAAWLEESIRHGDGGSCAHFSLVRGWSRPYPETTGYLIPTLIALARALPGFDGQRHATQLGTWLLSLQDADGWWRGLLHPPRADVGPSVFNTAQIVQGLVALHDLSGEPRWLEAATRACRWLAAGVGSDGLWDRRDYRTTGTPSYYTYAARPMLEVALRCDDAAIRNAAEGVLRAILTRRRPNGSFSEWGFSEGEAAFTHTIGYTLQGLVESAKLLDDWGSYGEPTEAGLLALARHSERADGRLAGRLDDDWKPAARYVCLTGNDQIALFILDWEERDPDPRLVSAAARLVDTVCAAQRLRAPASALRGAVGGSAPIWGGYLMLRYPNHAAKYHCDALMRLSARLGAGPEG
jgi:hypothetical protein